MYVCMYGPPRNSTRPAGGEGGGVRFMTADELVLEDCDETEKEIAELMLRNQQYLKVGR